MKHKKRARLRAIGRWAVWVCTALLVVLIPVSIWSDFSVTVYFVNDNQTSGYQQIDMGLSRLRAEIDYSPAHSIGCFGDIPDEGLHVELSAYGPFPPVQDGWWVWFVRYQGGGSSGTYTRWSFPLVYPAILMLGWSLWLIPFWKWWKHVGLEGVECQQCGYSLEGLTSGVCPECGEKYEA